MRTKNNKERAMPIEEAVKLGLHHQTMGRLDRAQKIYEDVLKVDPNQADAWHLLGLVYSARGEHLRGADMIRSAIRLVPNNSVYLGNLGVLLKFGGEFEKAIEAYRAAHECDPVNSDHLFHLGKAYRLVQKDELAERAFRESIRLAPTKASPWLSLLNLLADHGRFDEAVLVSEQAIQMFVKNADILLTAGSIFRRANQCKRAQALYEQILAGDPLHLEAHCRLSTLCITQNDFVQGQIHLSNAEAIDPNSPNVLLAAGMLHNGLGNATLAVQLYERSLAAKPDQATAHANIASALKKLGRLTDALNAIQKSLELDEKVVESYVVEAGIHLCLGEHDDAEAAFRKAIGKRRGFRDAHDGLLMCLQYRPGVTCKSLYVAHQEWSDLYVPAKDPLACEETKLGSSRSIDSKSSPLRIGFVSADLGAHPVGYFTYRLFDSLDKERFQTFVYSDRIGCDAMTDRMKGSVHRWNETATLSDSQLSEKIRADSIDVLFDLSGHTAQNRLMVFAGRCAPVQVTWAGYVGTTGVRDMDYLLADRWQVLPGTEEYYSEKILRMPDGYVTFYPVPDAPEVGPLPFDRNGFVTFGSMCNPAKVNESVIELWGAILERVPGAQMILSYIGWPDPTNKKRIERQLGGALFSRFLFEYASGAAKAMEVYNRIDLALDTFPYSGGLTTCESLWMGVPVVTLPGDTFAGRHSLSHLMNVGLPEFVASDTIEYVDLAVKWASEPAALQDLRANLRRQVLESPLCDGPRFARHFEELISNCVRNSGTS
jgi:predicted O-linked N-acetylglucosamine transferase (SPINDLY family)